MALKKAIALRAFSLAMILPKPMREWSSTATWTNSQPACALRQPLSIAGDPVAGTLEATELLDVDMDQFAGPLAFMTANRGLGLERAQSVESQAFENATDRGRGKPQLGGNLFAGAALPT